MSKHCKRVDSNVPQNVLLALNRIRAQKKSLKSRNDQYYCTACNYGPCTKKTIHSHFNTQGQNSCRVLFPPNFKFKKIEPPQTADTLLPEHDVIESEMMESATLSLVKPIVPLSDIRRINEDCVTYYQNLSEDNKKWIGSLQLEWILPYMREIQFCISGSDHSKGSGVRCDAFYGQFCSCAPRQNPNWKNCFKDPDDPIIAAIKTGEPLPASFNQVRVYFWIPELFYFPIVRHVPCPFCTKGKGQRKGWCRSGPKSIVNLGSKYFILSRTYRCDQCSKEYLGYHPDVIKKLPPCIQEMLPANAMTSGMDKQTEFVLERQICNGQAVNDFRCMLEETS